MGYRIKTFDEAQEDCRVRLGGFLGVRRKRYKASCIKYWFKNDLEPSK